MEGIQYYWVNQGDNYEFEKENGIIWAPNNTNFFHHQKLKDLKKGDKIIHYSQGYVRSTSEVVEESIIEKNPYQKVWGKDGFLVKLKYEELSNPIPLETLQTKMPLLKGSLPEKYIPFNDKNKINQGYLFEFSKRGYEILFQLETQTNSNSLQDISHFLANPNNYYWMAYILSLISKPFVILTGNSGTGKTRIAIQLAQVLNKKTKDSTKINYSIIPVGADWTDNRNIIGFYDAIHNLYRSTPVLDLIVDANQNPTIPFFLILDEMNLSHVERYFSDFLSAMESNQEIPLHSILDELESDSNRSIPQKIKIPPNLFITGTVNIDETTYMFSPKVLDRANVIEFKITKEDIRNYLDNQANSTDYFCLENFSHSLLELSLMVRGFQESNLENPNTLEIKKTIEDLYSILEGSGLEFAYRTISEILRFNKVSYTLLKDSWDWKMMMDIQILQKVLPKLHGSRKKLERYLLSLRQYLYTGKIEELKINTNELNYTNAIFPKSFQKVSQLIESLQRDQFVSFIS